MKNPFAMMALMAAAIVSSRRLGELCRMTHGDVDWAKGIYWVRDCKHPTRKKGNDKDFALLPELGEIILRQPRLDANDPTERIFPYDEHTASSRGTLARKALGIIGLRTHDNRREAISRWLKKLGPHKVKRYVSGHDNMRTLERHYDGTEARELLEEFPDLIQPKPLDTRLAA